jgi:hypothetical protein
MLNAKFVVGSGTCVHTQPPPPHIFILHPLQQFVLQTHVPEPTTNFGFSIKTKQLHIYVVNYNDEENKHELRLNYVQDC